MPPGLAVSLLLAQDIKIHHSLPIHHSLLQVFLTHYASFHLKKMKFSKQGSHIQIHRDGIVLQFESTGTNEKSRSPT